MEPLRINLACGNYDRTQALMDGSVPVEGVRLNYIAMGPEEIFWRQYKFKEFDVSEVSMCNTIMLAGRGVKDFVAIPVFPSRFFRHSNIFINTRKGIKVPQDFKGKRIGVPEYHMTALLWIRGMLQHEYGVHPEDVHWVLAGLEDAGREDRLPFTMPSRLSWEQHHDRTLTEMLDRGEVDALICARAPSCFTNGSANVARLFPNYWEVEMDYYKRTRLFPIMHSLAIRRDVYDENPWLAPSLLKAFEQAKNHAMNQLWSTGTLKAMIPWLIPVLEQQKSVFEGDCWPYGLEANRPTLETMVQYAHEQGLIERKVAMDELFAPNALSLSKI